MEQSKLNALDEAFIDGTLEKCIHAHANQVAKARVRENNITWLIITLLFCVIFVGFEILNYNK